MKGVTAYGQAAECDITLGKGGLSIVLKIHVLIVHRTS